ncbi:MAG: hypothetical protein Q8L21_02740, partial [Candidatus Komeilibacteria bacterium]|nr:hypothetical protein [Candidatus Komeilibacteria bacterium]
MSYFTDDITTRPLGRIGMEVETSFIDADGQAISFVTSQLLFKKMLSSQRWCVSATKGNSIAELRHQGGDFIRYELGRQNIEVSTSPEARHCIISHVQLVMDELYEAARIIGAYPYFSPILRSDGNLLAV